MEAKNRKGGITVSEDFWSNQQVRMERLSDEVRMMTGENRF